MSTLHLRLDFLETPIGRFALVADDAGRLHAAGFCDQHFRMDRQLQSYIDGGVDPARGVTVSPGANPGGLTAALARYFSGDLGVIADLPVAMSGTDFQRTVWLELREIPHGETWSYAELARRIGRPKAVRAVGLANGANPVGVVVPCHRVIGSSGALTGYGGGIDRKRWLLEHERALRADAQSALFA